jgi:triosephosphate isomerase (TIM)
MKGLLIVANWKMNKTKIEAKEFLNEFLPLVKNTEAKIIIAPSFTSLDFLTNQLQNTNISTASQNMFFAPSGAFTGEISAEMLLELGVEYVILGHSERRQYFLETDSLVNKKALFAFENNLKPIICVGETLEQKVAGLSKEIVKEQVTVALKDVEENDLDNIIIAYEPVWAIGTGEAMSEQQANEMAGYIINIVKESLNTTKAVKVLYGGSVNENNAKNFFEKENISGALIGGTSLDAKKFAKLIVG